jgi:hypothetical protein
MQFNCLFLRLFICLLFGCARRAHFSYLARFFV